MGINLGIIEAGNGKEAYDYLMSDDNKGGRAWLTFS